MAAEAGTRQDMQWLGRLGETQAMMASEVCKLDKRMAETTAAMEGRFRSRMERMEVGGLWGNDGLGLLGGLGGPRHAYLH